jgi:adenylate cyclase class 2
VFETNAVFDTVGGSLWKAEVLLRLRKAGRRATLTFKGPGRPGRHKSREEIEFAVSDPLVCAQLLQRLGYATVFRYEKYRTEYRRGGTGGVATLDETPIGIFLELEGAPAWIDRTARTLGFSTSDYILQSYGGLYLNFCRLKRLPRARMVFRPGLLRSSLLKKKSP